MDLSELDATIKARRIELQQLETARTTILSILDGHRPGGRKRAVPEEGREAGAGPDLTGISTADAICQVAKDWTSFTSREVIAALRAASFLEPEEGGQKVYSSLNTLVKSGRVKKNKRSGKYRLA